jgi:hypothetical protein
MAHDPNILQRRCPRLGDLVRFSYCRSCEQGQQTCFKVFDCWWEYFDVVDYLRRELPINEFERLATTQPANKVTSLLDLVAQAQQRCSDAD